MAQDAWEGTFEAMAHVRIVLELHGALTLPLVFKIRVQQIPENQNCFPGRSNMKSPVNTENVYFRICVKIANDRISLLG